MLIGTSPNRYRLRLRDMRHAALIMSCVATLQAIARPVAAQTWLVEANQRIEQHRKADLTVKVVDSLGTPVPGADVHVEMKRHTFGWGTAVTAGRINSNSSNNITYKQKLLENFNHVVFKNDLKWPQWLGGSWNATQQALNWLDANRLPARGHYLSWATEDGSANYDGGNNDHSTLETRLYAHITDKMQTVKGRVFEWDVINHPVGWTGQTYENDPDVNEGTDIFKQIIDHARGVAVANTDIPDDLPLWINEDDIIRGSGGRANNYERIIQYLVENGSPPDGIGFQGHFIDAWNGVTTNYQGIYNKIDRFAQFGLPLRVTEFDIAVGDDEALQGTLMNNYLTVIFSHPAIEAITMWGFWEGSFHMPEAALYRNDWSEKPALTAYQDLVFNDWWTDTEGNSDESGEYLIRAFKGEYEITVVHNGVDYVVPVVVNDDMSINVSLPFSIGLTGDYNDDGLVDAADYVVWRKFAGTMTDLPNDNGIVGPVGAEHYNLWRANFGNSAPGSGAAFQTGVLPVPEPTSALLAIWAAAWFACHSPPAITRQSRKLASSAHR
ncbi:MAG TPA: endo-1,4-beta-xylanase, partial [Mycobacterium sp.]